MKVNTPAQKVFVFEQQNTEQQKRDVPQNQLTKDNVTDMDKAEVKQAVEKLNKTAQVFNKRFHFSIHEQTHRVMVQIIDTVTDEVINEIPPKKVLDIIASMNELLGLIIDERV